MFFEKSNLLFLHPGKCAGTSVENYLLDVLDEPLLPKAFEELMELNRLKNPSFLKGIKASVMYGLYRDKGVVPQMYLHHADLRTCELIMGNKRFSLSKKIAIVRHPIPRTLSAYYYNGWSKRMSFREFVLDTLEERFMKNEHLTVNHFGLMSRFTHSNGEKAVDLIVKQEDFKGAIRSISDMLGTPFRPPERMHAKTKASSLYADAYDAYDDKMKKVVYRLFSADFDLLGY